MERVVLYMKISPEEGIENHEVSVLAILYCQKNSVFIENIMIELFTSF